MNNIYILDCTLRDGGYINNWNFGESNIGLIIDKLNKSNIDYIELGYYTKTRKTDTNLTLYDDLKKLDLRLSQKKYLVMINYKEVSIDDIPLCKDINNIFGIRVAFHKDDCAEAIEFCSQLKEKGWNIFVQPMVSVSYSEKEFKELIKKVNELEPYALYIADSFGTMTEKEVIDKFAFIGENLGNDIAIGFHSHNNLQLSYSNVITLLNMNLDRKIFIDSSVYGMGRGAGNLNTELIVKYMNTEYNKNYHEEYILQAVDECLIKEKEKNNWGYCLEYYLSAIYNCHPNYSKFLSEIHTLTISDINSILKMIVDNKKNRFDKEYIYELYLAYLNHKIDDSKSYDKLSHLLAEKKIILMGVGKSLVNEREKIEKVIDDDSVIISLNSKNDMYPVNYIFVSNRRRFHELCLDKLSNIICTSNVAEDFDNNILVFDYLSNLADEYEVNDNVLLIILNILEKSKIENVYLCGFDGYSYEKSNYYSDALSYTVAKERIDNINNEVKKYVKLYSKKINMNWITKSSYIEEED